MRPTVRLVLVALVLLPSGAGLLAQHGGMASPFSGPTHGDRPTFTAPRSPSTQEGRQGHWPSWTPSHHRDDARHGSEHRNARGDFYGGYFPFASYGYSVPLGYGPAYSEAQEASGPQAAPPPPERPAVDYGPEAESPQVATDAPNLFRPAYQAPANLAPVFPQPVTTLIFKDGRPPVQVRSYALTGSTLYALDGDMRQEIPLSMLNVPATVQANRAAGVDFALPVGR